MYNKKRIIIGVCLLGLITLTAFLIFRPKDLSLIDITSDNFNTKLKRVDKDLKFLHLSNCIPDKIDVNLTYLLPEMEDNSRKIERGESDGMLHISYESKSTMLIYKFVWKNGELINFYITPTYSDDDDNHGYQLKSIIDKLILTKQFILKESVLKTGSDILIKESEDCFIIVTLQRSYSEKISSSIFLWSYAKHK